MKSIELTYLCLLCFQDPLYLRCHWENCYREMEDVLWYLLASSRGGQTRVRLLRAIERRPRNANQLADELDLDYTTVRHHLDVLMENNVLRRSDNEYGAIYLFTDQVRSNWETVETILETVDQE